VFHGWLVNTPVLHGTWRGQLQTTWPGSSSGQPPEPVETYMAIRQTFLSIHLTMYTRESVSLSDAATICVDEDRGVRLLSYTYANVPSAEVRDRSQIHYGAARLRIITKPEQALEGEYWTDRMSSGHLELTYVSRDIVERFPGSTQQSQ